MFSRVAPIHNATLELVTDVTKFLLTKFRLGAMITAWKNFLLAIINLIISKRLGYFSIWGTTRSILTIHRFSPKNHSKNAFETKLLRSINYLVSAVNSQQKYTNFSVNEVAS